MDEKRAKIRASQHSKRLNENNAEDIYDGLKKLKGSALKVAQMLSMEKSILPQAYVEKFSLAQFSLMVWNLAEKISQTEEARPSRGPSG